MKAVWKYSVPVNDEWNKIEMPLDASIVHVDRAEQVDEVWVWVEIDLDEKETATVEFRVFGTGHQVPDDAGYWGTVSWYPNIPLVWHLYERLPWMTPPA